MGILCSVNNMRSPNSEIPHYDELCYANWATNVQDPH